MTDTTNAPLPARPVALSHRPQARGKLSPCVTAPLPRHPSQRTANVQQHPEDTATRNPKKHPASSDLRRPRGLPRPPQGTFTPLGPFPHQMETESQKFPRELWWSGSGAGTGGVPPPRILRCPQHPPGRFLAAGGAAQRHSGKGMKRFGFITRFFLLAWRKVWFLTLKDQK